jgi:hypothetical protein
MNSLGWLLFLIGLVLLLTGSLFLQVVGAVVVLVGVGWAVEIWRWRKKERKP